MTTRTTIMPAAGDREATFASTANRIVNNSETAPRQGFQQAMEAVGKPTEISMDLTPIGILVGGAKKVFDAMRGNAAERATNRFAEQLGGASVAQGAARDRLVQALMQYQDVANAPMSPGAARLINALAGTREDAIQRYLPAR